MTEFEPSDGSNESKSVSKSKIARVIHHYDLDSLGDELIDYWIRNDHEQRSLRELADYFNTNLLRTTMDSAGMSTLDGEVTNTYRLLTADDVSTGVRTQLETTLERNGIDPEQLHEDFVSHQAIHTYLTQYRGVQRHSEASEQDRLTKTETTIQRLKSRLVAVAEKRLRSLRDADTITLGTFSVLVDVRVVCEDCGAHVDIPTLLSEAGCECDPK
jgi:hypothetical protein